MKADRVEESVCCAVRSETGAIIRSFVVSARDAAFAHATTVPSVCGWSWNESLDVIVIQLPLPEFHSKISLTTLLTAPHVNNVIVVPSKKSKPVPGVSLFGSSPGLFCVSVFTLYRTYPVPPWLSQRTQGQCATGETSFGWTIPVVVPAAAEMLCRVPSESHANICVWPACTADITV